ncbi:Ankyrin repeat domain-containing protein 17 [Colletotrichum siamense]|uniref:Ankyrin repeat domain-containing protein 17 n=1 Tax=Colletotrichum siamense TaxID=690259 RepID=A0A9P5F5G5_COLSI|nr:Ankyrin repeat domain-containing protein 17 [Colletotrichum siamense]KAF4867305.1 Ankyrin repeat domain-containing protein 17 [Colletotrichum siamense]
MQKSLPPLDAAWDPTLQTDDGEEYCWTPLQLAARGGELENIREILAANPAAVNEPPRGYYGQTAIQAACMHGHEQAVQMLVDAGADIHFCGGNNFQRNALQIACGHGDEKVVDILLGAGAKVNEVLSKPAHPTHGSPASSVFVTRYNGRTALQAAAERGHEHLVTRLLELGADVNAPPSPTAGYTALQAAAGGGYLTILKLLLQHGADINGASAKYKGYTALQGACLGGHLEIVDLLIKEGANVHALGAARDEKARLHFKAPRVEVTIKQYRF